MSDNSKFSKNLYAGIYNYRNKAGEIYSEESFTVSSTAEKPTQYLYKSELLTRAETGEFLKINCRYEVNQNFQPTYVVVQKYLGEFVVTETYTPDHEKLELHYQFEKEGELKECVISTSSKFHINTPTFTTSLIFTEHVKINPTGRTKIQIVSSNNYWSYQEDISIQELFIELNPTIQYELIINKKSLKSTPCLIYQYDIHQRVEETPIKAYLSKHKGLAYRGEISPECRIEIGKLKQLEDTFKSNV